MGTTPKKARVSTEYDVDQTTEDIAMGTTPKEARVSTEYDVDQTTEDIAIGTTSKKARVSTVYDVAAMRMAIATKEVLTLEEAAMYLGISRASIKGIIKAGGLPICKIVGSASPLILREDLVQHVRCRREDGHGHPVVEAPMTRPGSAGSYFDAGVHAYVEMHPIEEVRGRRVI